MDCDFAEDLHCGSVHLLPISFRVVNVSDMVGCEEAFADCYTASCRRTDHSHGASALEGIIA